MPLTALMFAVSPRVAECGQQETRFMALVREYPTTEKSIGPVREIAGYTELDL